MRVISIDPALRKTGYGVLELARGERDPRCLAFGVIDNPKALSQSQCLVQIHEHLKQVIEKHQPDECAVESVIYVQSYKTAITMGAARGAAILAAAQVGLPVHEYPPKTVKQGVVGKGSADKSQVAFMVRALLHLQETPPPDAADALAIGMTHLHKAKLERQKKEA